MQYDIDYPRAKEMASRLQDFLAGNPKPTLSRSSSIEAIARILGFNNRNEMAARLTPTPSGPPTPASREELARTSLSSLLANEKKVCASSLYEAASRHRDAGSFRAAAHAGSDDGGKYALIEVEDEIAEQLRREPGRLTLLHAALRDSPEMESAREIRTNNASVVAYALVNEAYPLAETLWKKAQIVNEDAPRAETLWKDPPAAGGDPLLGYDVDVSCWIPGSLQVELPGDRVGEIEAEVLCFATIHVDAANEDNALIEAERCLAEGLPEMIWNPRPDRGTRKSRWSGSARGEDTGDYIEREDKLVESNWELDFARASDFSADQIAG